MTLQGQWTRPGVTRVPAGYYGSGGEDIAVTDSLVGRDFRLREAGFTWSWVCVITCSPR